jgi:hypothetical protein
MRSVFMGTFTARLLLLASFPHLDQELATRSGIPNRKGLREFSRKRVWDQIRYPDNLLFGAERGTCTPTEIAPAGTSSRFPVADNVPRTCKRLIFQM